MSSILFVPEDLRRGDGDEGYVRQHDSAGGGTCLSRPLVVRETNLYGQNISRPLGYLRDGLEGKMSMMRNTRVTSYFKGMVKYWDIGGVKDDYWIQCEDKEREWFEFNCTYLPNIGQRSR